MRYQKEAGGEGEEGGKGGKAAAIDPAAFAALQESVAKLEAKNKELLQEKAEAKKAADKAAQEAAKKSGDIEALEKSWNEKLADEVAARDKQIAELTSTLNRATSGAEAAKLAAALALPGSADVLLPHISSRLTTEFKDGAATVRVLGKDGKPSAATLDDLRKEIVENQAFAPLLVGSKANGAGAVGGKSGGGVQVVKRAQFDQMSPAQRMDIGLKAKKGEARIED